MSPFTTYSPFPLGLCPIPYSLLSILLHSLLEGNSIVEVLLPEGLTVEDLDRLSGVESKTILQDLPRPFFRIDCPGRFLLTGIVGNPKLRFTMRRSPDSPPQTADTSWCSTAPCWQINHATVESSARSPLDCMTMYRCRPVQSGL